MYFGHTNYNSARAAVAEYIKAIEDGAKEKATALREANPELDEAFDLAVSGGLSADEALSAAEHIAEVEKAESSYEPDPFLESDDDFDYDDDLDFLDEPEYLDDPDEDLDFTERLEE